MRPRHVADELLGHLGACERLSDSQPHTVGTDGVLGFHEQLAILRHDENTSLCTSVFHEDTQQTIEQLVRGKLAGNSLRCTHGRLKVERARGATGCAR